MIVFIRFSSGARPKKSILRKRVRMLCFVCTDEASEKMVSEKRQLRKGER